MTTNCLDNHEKFIQLYELYYQDLLRYAISIVKSHSAAEELVHDAYVKILKRIEDIEEPASARTKRYLVITVRNTCYDYLLKFVPAEDLTEYEAIQSDPLDMVWDTFSVNEIKKKLMIFLEGLSERNRNLFIDAVVLGYHYKELSKKYGLTETNISVKIFRFRVRLRKLLEQEDQEMDEKELFEQFMHHNIPQEAFDPDQVLAAARKAVPDDYQPSEHFKKDMDKLLRQSRRQARIGSAKKFFTRKGIPQVAVSLSVIICALFVAQANNGEIFDLLFQTHQTHTGIQLTEQVREELMEDKTSSMDMQVYFPKYVPEGYAITDMELFSRYLILTLKNEKSYISIIQYPINGYNSKFALDSEDTALEEVTVNEYAGFYKVKDGIHTLHFFDNNNYYKIKGNDLSKKEIIRIAESLEMVV